MIDVALKEFTQGGYDPGATFIKRVLWYFLGAPVVRSTLLPSSRLKVAILRLFGACIGRGVRIKPGLKVKFPWRLSVGDHSWIGEDVWIDNLAVVVIGSNTCISQAVYFCTGSHDWSSRRFDLLTKPIEIGNGCWIAARCAVAPGTIVGDGAAVTLQSVVQGSLAENTIYGGVPFRALKERLIRS